MKNLNFRVVISGIINGNENAGYGFYVNGSDKRFDWTLYNGVANSTAGILLDRWISNISKSVDIRRFGKYASIGGGTIYTDNTQSIYDFIRQQGIDLQGRLLQVYEISDEVEALIYKGVCTTLSYSKTSISIEFDDLTRYRESVIGERFGADSFTPAVFGKMDKAKFVEYESELKQVKYDDGSDLILQGNKFEDASFFAENFGLQFFLDLDNTKQVNGLSMLLYINSIIGKPIYLEHFLGEGTGIIRAKAINDLGSLGDKRTIVMEILENSFFINEDGETLFKGTEDTLDPQQVSYFKLYEGEAVNIIDTWDESGGLTSNLFTTANNEYVSVPDSDNDIKINGNKITLVSSSLEDFGTVKGLTKCELLNKDNLFQPWGGAPSSVAELQEHIPQDNSQFTDAILCDNQGDETLSDVYLFNNNRGVGRSPTDVKIFGTPANNGFKNITDYNHSTSVGIQFVWNIDQTPNYLQGFAFPLIFQKKASEKYRLLYDLDINHNLAVISFAESGLSPNVHTSLIGTYKNIFEEGFFFESKRAISPGFNPIGHRLNNAINIDSFIPINNSDLSGDTSQGRLSRNRQYYRHDNFELDTGETFGGLPRLHKFYSGYDTFAGEEISLIKIDDKPISQESISVNVIISIVGRAGEQIDQNTTTVYLRAFELFGVVDVNFSEGIYGSWRGRKDPDSLLLLQKPSDIYEHILRLQRYSTDGISAPSKGWGLEYVADYSNLIGTIPEVTGEYANQLFTEQELLTQNIKNDLLRSMWSYGSQGWDGKEVLYKMVDAFDEDVSRVEIDNVDIKKDSIREVKETNKADIFCMPALKYDYDIGLDGYKKEIAVVNVELETFEDDNTRVIADGLTFGEKHLIWSKCRQLFLYYGVINPNPQTLTENKWIKTDADADKYVRRWLAWQGATDENVEPFSERRSLSFQVHYEYFREKDLDVGSLISLEVPFVSDQRIIGIVNSVNINLQKGNEFVTVGVFVKVPEPFDLVIESGDRTDEIIESGDRQFNIIEGGQ